MGNSVKNIVPIYKGDESRILEIGQTAYLDLWVKKDFVRALHLQKAQGVKIEDVSKRIVGFMVFCRHERSVLEIWKMAISPEYRRMGYGSYLIEYLKRRLDNQLCKGKIWIKVNEYNLDGQVFLQSCGFRCESIIRQNQHVFCRKTQDELLMIYRKSSCLHNRFHFGGGFDATDV